MKNYHIPMVNDGEWMSNDYAANIDGEALPIKQIRVTKYPFNTWWPGHQRSIDQTELASYTNFSLSGKITLTIRCNHKKVERVEIRPATFGIEYEVKGQLIVITIEKPCYFTLEINDSHRCLHVFADKPEEYDVDMSDERLIYFGPGIHRAGLIKLESDQTLYLHESAVVYGSVYAENAENIRILGRGVIDSSPYKRLQEVVSGTYPGEEIIGSLHELGVHRPIGNLLLKFCKNVTVDGILFKDPPHWSFDVYDCENVVINNIKMLGLWRYNADGIDIFLGKNFEISGCFIRSFDDSIVARGSCGAADRDVFENMNVHDCVLWCEWGRALEIWTTFKTAHMKDIFFKNCYIIRTCHVAMDVQIYGSGTTVIDNVRFEDIYLETDLHADRPVYQKHDAQVYMNTDENYMPLLLFAGNAYKFEKPVNRLNQPADICYKNLLFKNIYVSGNRMPQSIVKTIEGHLKVESMVIDGMFFNGKRLDTPEEMNLDADFENADISIIGG